MRCAIIGSGNIGTDLMVKMMRSDVLDLVALVGIDPDSDGLARAHALGLEAPHSGPEWVLENAKNLDMIFDATSAYVHVRHYKQYAAAGITAVDLTPAARGPKVIPAVNLYEHLDAPNVNMVTCGGQATTPMVYAIRRAIEELPYAEMVSTVASKSAGPGTRQNIDEFTKTTSTALREIGGAVHSKAIMVLNPAEPPIMMRNTVFAAIPEGSDHAAILESVHEMVAGVSQYVPGYRLKNAPVIEEGPFHTPGGVVPHRAVVLLEVEGAGDYLPPYAGNLDIMTAAAMRVGEAIAQSRKEKEASA
ncbi:MAG: acetaldehyde dehydrogenase (acetylating) [Candidatus Nanopelagicales bacterium]|jgi:acetaldehyde dehydrogenase|nr:acetaldehyde dehydrogenase (acetylating) [Actinomycetes bacterium]MCH9738403.1 acetaldehyde dehydrogenase (acetylating) [Actinomycetes bacterium]MCH9830765.1 acetaldehyde dehydrogenase (acetylating) [Actinomycetes bacterium]MCH9839696.1 acetaldehyde dehydrogenase (acetylating) [Actinomycetes bacterium]